MIFKYSSLFCLFFYPAISFAEISSGYGEYFFGPETSEAKACENAQNKAKAMAIRSLLGESFFSDQQMYCKDSNVTSLSNPCEFNSYAWSFIEGDIKNISNLSSKVEKKLGSTVCIVTLNADVLIPQIKADPNFQVKAQRLKFSYKAGEDFTIDFESTLPAYFAIFNWLPNENNKINRILISPSADKYDSDVLKKNNEGKYHFRQTFTTFWSSSYIDERRLYDEWILLVVTKRPYKWLNTYEFEEFKQKLNDIPIDQRRLEKLGFQIHK